MRGGLLFEPEQCKRFAEEWSGVLKEYGLPYFRMSECAHCTGAFKDKKSVADAVARRMIGIIKRRATIGVAACVSEQDVRNTISEQVQSWIGGAYGVCIRWCLGIVRESADKRDFNGTISYFFESGHRYQKAAGARIAGILEAPGGQQRYRYAGHAFSAKEPTPSQPVAFLPLQAADLLAWHFRTF